MARLRQLVTRGRTLILAPVLLAVTLSGWALSSPVGSSPDDDFHLVSIWCATGDDAYCVQADGETEAVVPGALLGASCYAFDTGVSGACQDEYDFFGSPDETTERGNFYGAYPEVFYGAMSLFVGPDIEASVLGMRIFGVLVFTTLATALFLLLPPGRRPTLGWSWVVTTVPLGLFVLSSNNPSSWAVAGVGLGWLALAGFLESRGARKVGLAVVFAASVVLATGSRGDASLYLILAILGVVVLQARRSRRFALDSILPAAAVVVCLLMFRVSRPVADVTQGIEPDAGLRALLARILPSFLDVPSLWTGIFGDGWGLGWLDTSMPSVVWLGTFACFVGAGIIAGAHRDLRKTLVLAGGLAVLWLLPTAILVAAGQGVGSNVQPRYLLPLIVLFAGVLFWEPHGEPIRFGRAQRHVIVGVLALAQMVALYLNLVRYVQGFDDLGTPLGAAAEWWWHVPVAPVAVWVAASIAYTALLVLLLRGPTVTAPAIGLIQPGTTLIKDRSPTKEPKRTS